MQTSPAAALLAALACGLACAQEPAGLAARIGKVPKGHPRLLLTAPRLAQIEARLGADPLLARLAAHVRAGADAILDAAPVRREKVGRRLLGVSRTCLKRVTHLAFTYRRTKDARYLQRARAELLAAAGFRDWNPSHFLDVAEMTAALALGYDWLHDDLDPAARATIRAALVDKGLRASLRGGWWVDTTNNWNQVCHGGLTLGALAVVEHEPELATRIVARAVRHLPRAMHEYAPDGAYPEGPSYWEYGTTYNVLLLDALETVLGTDFGLTAAEGFLRSADYYLHMTGPTGEFFNYSDCGRRGSLAPAMSWFAGRRGDPSLLFRERAALQELLEGGAASAGSGGRMLPFALVWSTAAAAERPGALHFHAAGPTPVAVHRSSWEPTATFVGVKGGSPYTNHAHMDIGSFVLDAQGVRWADDLGAQSYHSLESKGIRLWDRGQDGQRWTVFRLNNLAHNTLVVDGRMQRVKGNAPITASTGDGPMPHTLVEMGSVYAGQLAAARRGVGLRADGSVLVQDEFEAPDRAVSVRWGMVTRARVRSARDAVAVLERDGRTLTVRVLEPADAVLRTFDTSTPKAAHDHPNPGTRMVGFTVEVPAAARRRLVVWLAPGTAPGIAAGPPPVTALDAW